MYSVLDSKNTTLGLSKGTPEDLDEWYSFIQGKSDEKLQNEFFEVLDKDGKKTGAIKLRDHVHSAGDWHGSFHMHGYSMEDQPYIYLQQRAWTKDVQPGKLDALVAGHYGIGETLKDGAREAKEEIGIDVDVNTLYYAGTRLEVEKANCIWNREVQDVTFYKMPEHFSLLNIQEEEVLGVFRVPVYPFIAMMQGRLQELQTVEAMVYAESGLVYGHASFTLDDVWPADDNYYVKAAILVSKLAEGKKIPKKPFHLPVERLLGA